MRNKIDFLLRIIFAYIFLILLYPIVLLVFIYCVIIGEEKIKDFAFKTKQYFLIPFEK